MGYKRSLLNIANEHISNKKEQLIPNIHIYTMKQINKIIPIHLQYILLGIAIFCFNLNHSFAVDIDADKEIVKTIEHSGKLKLAYHGFIDQTPPLAPLQKVEAHTKFFYVTPGVVSPSIQSVFLLEHTIIEKNDVVLDIGSGSGIQSIFASDVAKKVVATDLSWAAVRNTEKNVEYHNVQDIVDIRQGDLFSSISPKEQFDVILFNIDYPENKATEGLWKVHERFFNEVNQYLKPQGRIYYQTGRLRNITRTYSLLRKNKLRAIKMDMATTLYLNKDPIVLLIIKNPNFNPNIGVNRGMTIHNLK